MLQNGSFFSETDVFEVTNILKIVVESNWYSFQKIIWLMKNSKEDDFLKTSRFVILRSNVKTPNLALVHFTC